MCKFHCANRILGDLIGILPSRANRLDTLFKFFGESPIEFYRYYANWWQTIASIREKILRMLGRAWMVTFISATSLLTIIDRENRFEVGCSFFVFFFFCSKQFQINIELDILLFPRWKNRFGGKWKVSILSQTIWGIAL